MGSACEEQFEGAGEFVDDAESIENAGEPIEDMEGDVEKQLSVPPWKTCQIRGLTESADLQWFEKRGCKAERMPDGLVVIEKPQNVNELCAGEVDIMLKKIRQAWSQDLVILFFNPKKR